MKIKYKILTIGLFLLSGIIFMFYQKLLNDNYQLFSAIRASIFDGYFGFILLFVTFILAISLISYSLNINIKLSNLGKYLVKLFEIIKNNKK